MSLGLHHAQITIPEGSEDEARDFYCRLLGLKEIQKPESLAGRGGLWLAAGDRQVHLGVENGVDRSATKAHLAYEVEDLEQVRRTLAAEGYEVLHPPQIPGYERFETRDLFGNRKPRRVYPAIRLAYHLQQFLDLGGGGLARGVC